MTVITESFNKADSTVLGPDLSWTEFLDWAANNSHAVVSNTARSTGNGSQRFARAESDLASGDHYALVTVTTHNTAVAATQARLHVRCSSGDTDSYFASVTQAGSVLVRKNIGGTLSTLATGSTTISVPYTIRIEVFDTTVRVRINNESWVSATDTDLGNTRTRAGIGVNVFTSAATTDIAFDDFEAGDLASTAVKDMMGGYIPFAR